MLLAFFWIGAPVPHDAWLDLRRDYTISHNSYGLGNRYGMIASWESCSSFYFAMMTYHNHVLGDVDAFPAQILPYELRPVERAGFEP